MNLPWIIGIPLWLLIGWGAFAYFERYAFKHPDRLHTLSRFMSDLGAKWPLSIYILGFLCGSFVFGLGVHFWWHFCPPGSFSTG